MILSRNLFSPENGNHTTCYSENCLFSKKIAKHEAKINAIHFLTRRNLTFFSISDKSFSLSFLIVIHGIPCQAQMKISTWKTFQSLNRIMYCITSPVKKPLSLENEFWKSLNHPNNLLLVFLVTQNGTWNLCSRNRLRDVVVWTSSWTFNFKYLSLTEALRDAVFSETIPSSSQKLASKTTSGFLAVTADEALGRWRLFGYRTSSRACAVEGKSTEKSLN